MMFRGVTEVGTSRGGVDGVGVDYEGRWRQGRGVGRHGGGESMSETVIDLCVNSCPLCSHSSTCLHNTLG
jgi:hypothetical protein